VREISLCLRAFQLAATLLVALTFGLAVPAVAVACGIAATVEARHALAVLTQITDLAAASAASLGLADRPTSRPGPKPGSPWGEGSEGGGHAMGHDTVDLAGCTTSPRRGAAVVAATTLAAWGLASVGHLRPFAFWAAASGTAGSAVLAVAVATAGGKNGWSACRGPPYEAGRWGARWSLLCSSMAPRRYFFRPHFFRPRAGTEVSASENVLLEPLILDES